MSVSDSRRVLWRAKKEESEACGAERNTRARRRARVLSLTLGGDQFQTRRWTVSYTIDRSILSFSREQVVRPREMRRSAFSIPIILVVASSHRGPTNVTALFAPI